MSSLDSKTLFASFAVMAIVAAAFAGISILGEDSEAAISTGSASSPLSSLSGQFDNLADNTYYVLVGSSVNITISGSVFEFKSVTAGFGLSSSSNGDVSGTISNISFRAKVPYKLLRNSSGSEGSDHFSGRIGPFSDRRASGDVRSAGAIAPIGGSPSFSEGISEVPISIILVLKKNDYIL